MFFKRKFLLVMKIPFFIVIDLTNNAFMKIQRYLSSFLIVHCLVIFSPFILYIFNPKQMKKKNRF